MCDLVEHQAAAVAQSQPAGFQEQFAAVRVGVGGLWGYLVHWPPLIAASAATSCRTL